MIDSDRHLRPGITLDSEAEDKQDERDGWTSPAGLTTARGPLADRDAREMVL